MVDVPVCEGLLWTIRKTNPGPARDVRKKLHVVPEYTLARLLRSPSDTASRSNAKRAVAALKEALGENSQVAQIASHLEAPIDSLNAEIELERDEEEAWDAGESAETRATGKGFVRPLCWNHEPTGSGIDS